jgi:hypothetical protein
MGGLIMTNAKKEFTREEVENFVAYMKAWEFDIPQHVYEAILPIAEAFAARLAEDEANKPVCWINSESLKKLEEGKKPMFPPSVLEYQSEFHNAPLYTRSKP